jgi:hypothetical protein
MNANGEQHGGSLKSWAIVILFSLVILGWGLANFLLIRERPREWDFGALRDVPGQSIYSVDKTPTTTNAALQIPALPEAIPWKPGVSGTRAPVAPETRTKNQ